MIRSNNSLGLKTRNNEMRYQLSVVLNSSLHYSDKTSNILLYIEWPTLLYTDSGLLQNITWGNSFKKQLSTATRSIKAVHNEVRRRYRTEAAYHQTSHAREVLPNWEGMREMGKSRQRDYIMSSSYGLPKKCRSKGSATTVWQLSW